MATKYYYVMRGGGEREVNINKIKGLSICINGINNVVKIHVPYCFNNSMLSINGNNNIFECFSNTYSINNTTFNMNVKGDNRIITIGKNTYIGEALIINNKNDSSILIDDECMLSANIHIRTDDGHIICKHNTKEILNTGGNVIIGKHTWIARNVFISKNVSIAPNTIIGAGAVVTKSFEKPNTIIAGIPATVIKEDVDWYHNENELHKIFADNNEGVK